MRHPILHTLVVSLLAAAVAGCAKDIVPTGPMPGARFDGGPTRIEEPLSIDPKGYATIVAGKDFTCARRNDNTVYCWGQNDYGQIGFKSSTRSGKCFSGYMCVATPTLIRFLGAPLKALQLDAGDRHACILDEGGAAWCWGNGDNGQLGFGNTGWPFEPLAVVGGLTFSSIGAGGNSTCGTTTTGMFCWGASLDTFSIRAPDASSPLLVSKYAGYNSVAVGASHACALRFAGNDRFVDCWGNNAHGQLALDPGTFPKAGFAELSNFVPAVNDVTTQNDFTCVDQLSGVVECTGMNQWGQLGNGQSTLVAVGDPQIVGNRQRLHGVTTGYNHACALDDNNAAWCWGNGKSGQLGNGTQGVFNTPQLVSGGGTYRAIAAGMLHTCAIGMDLLIYCWGNNTSGQLGTGGFGDGVTTTPVQTTWPRS